MIELWLVRHGETPRSRARRLAGWADIPLTEEGESQARALRPLLEGQARSTPSGPPTCSAPSPRLVSRLARPKPDPRLREINFGALEDLPYAEMAEPVRLALGISRASPPRAASPSPTSAPESTTGPTGCRRAATSSSPTAVSSAPSAGTRAPTSSSPPARWSSSTGPPTASSPPTCGPRAEGWRPTRTNGASRAVRHPRRPARQTTVDLATSFLLPRPS